VTPARQALRQRADYTHKFNVATGRHGWLRLTPAYSVKIVEELLRDVDGRRRVLDPFCGTATTALCAAGHGHDAVTTDVNPFLVWFGGVKTARYAPATIAAARDAAADALGLVAREAVEPGPAPPIHHIERWWSADALRFLRLLRAAVDAATAPDTPEGDLLRVAFCRTLIACSNAAFDHQSMSFRDDGGAPGADLAARFAADVRFVLAGAAENPAGRAEVVLGDARDLAASVRGRVDLVITSPPYANRMSYVRELRPYMYWLGFLASGRAAGELDWTAIGGTWGIATSRLADWTRDARRFDDAALDAAVARIAAHDARSGPLLANYVTKYADDVWRHLQSLRAVLSPGAAVHYVVGNSTFYGVLLPVERLYVTMLERLGFTGVACRPIRKRNSKKALVEFDVSARWP
jgi:hypothetical protein